MAIDLVSLIDIDAILERAMNRDTRPHLMSVLERVRNVLVLVPIFVTWAGLALAASSYALAIRAEPALAGRPFLLLWEQGFDGHGLGGTLLHIPFSAVAAIDAVVIAAIGILTWIVHSQSSVAAAEHHIKTQALEDRLRDVVWDSSLELRKRGSIAGAIDRFGRTAKRLIDELRAEREHLTELVNARERRMGDLRNFARDFGSAAAAMSTSSADMATKVSGAIEANSRVAQQIEHLANAQEDVEARLSELVSQLSSTVDAARQIAGATEIAATTISEAVETVGPGTARMADSAQMLRLEVAELRQRLEVDESARQVNGETIARTMAAAIDAMAQASLRHREALTVLTTELLNLRQGEAAERGDSDGRDRR